MHIVRALLGLASAALVVRVMGMLNQVVVSSRYGAGAKMDAYFIASTLPLVLGQIIINTFQGSVIPTYGRIYSQGEKERATVLFSTLLNLSLIGTTLLLVLMLIFRQPIVLLSAPAVGSFRTGLADNLTLLLYPALLLTVIAGFLESIFNARGQFGWPAFTGLLIPLVTAILVFLLGRSQGIIMLCVGMLLGLCLQLGVMLVGARRAGLTYRPVIDLRSPESAAVLSASWPVLIGSTITMVSPLVDQLFASFLTTGSISALNYALKITSVFSGVVFAAVGRAILPYLSRQATHDMKDFKETLRLYLWLVGIGTTLLSLFMIVLAHPVVRILFQRGAFTAADTNHTAITLVGFLIGLTPMAFSFLAFTIFSALNKTRVLLHLALFSVFLNAVLDYVFAHIWQSFGIALATSVVYFSAMCIQLFVLRRLIGKLDLLTVPPELRHMREKIHPYYSRFVTWKEELALFGTFSRMRRQAIRMIGAMAVFTAGVVGIFFNYLYTLVFAFGSIVLLTLLRYPYALLIAWALYNALNTLPFLKGSHILIGLTVPTVLLAPLMPIKQTFRRMPALIFLLVYLLWVLAGIGISTLGVGLFLNYWAQFLNCLLLAILTINLLTTRRRLLGLIDTFLLLAGGLALFGIYGYFTKQYGAVDSSTSLFRIGSIFIVPPELALFLSIMLPLALYRTFISQGIIRILSLIVTLVFLVAIGLTFTRAAMISIPLSIYIMALCLPPGKLKIGMLCGISAVAAVVVALAVVGTLPIFDRFFNSDLTSLNGRTYLWDAVLANFDPWQLLGNGLYASNALLTALNVGVNGQGLIGTSPHSLVIGTLYDHGIIGLILITLVFIALFVGLMNGMRKTGGEHRMLFAAVLAVLVNIFIQSLDGNLIWDQPISIYIWFVMSLPFVLYWSSARQQAAAGEDVSGTAAPEPRSKAIYQNGPVHALPLTKAGGGKHAW